MNAEAAQAPIIDRQAFRAALGTFVTGVTIVTARAADGRPIGLTANSFNSVSLDPPLVLWSLALDSPNLPVFRDAAYWTVHILAAGQEALSSRFASRGTDKFAELPFEEGPGGVPLLEHCAARFICRASFEYEGGDHAIFVGEVIDLTLSGGPPLIFHGGKYGRVMPPGTPQRPAELPDEAEFGRYFIGHLLLRAQQAVFRDVRHEYRRRGMHAAEYTVLSSLGLGDGCTRGSLVRRAAAGGIELPQRAIDTLVERGDIQQHDDTLRLTQAGRRLLTELVAVAQAAQLRVEGRMTESELSLFHDLLARVAAEGNFPTV